MSDTGSDSVRDEFDRDDELRARLRAADPARSLGPADPAALSRLLARTVSSDLDEPSDAPSQRRRSPWTLLAGAAAAVVVATTGIGAVAHWTGGSGSSPAAAHPRTTESPLGTPALRATRLTMTSVQGRCAAAPTVQTLAAGTDTAFAGTVTAIDGDRVMLAADTVYRGQVGKIVEVTTLSAGLADVNAVQFKVGGHYLVSAAKGQVAVCGYSGKAGQGLTTLYQQAFPR